MKKQLIIPGIIAILVSIELSGSSTNVANFGGIQANPQKYLNKEVTVEGTCAMTGIMSPRKMMKTAAYNSQVHHYYNKIKNFH